MMESGNPATPWNSQNMSYAEKKLTLVAVTLGCLPPSSAGPVADAATVETRRKKIQKWAAVEFPSSRPY
jgi:hypothetical protein